MKLVPLHSLVIMVGPSGSGKSTLAKQYFNDYEIISSDSIRQELLGDFKRQDVNGVVFKEVHHRVALKLSIGERVVVDSTNLKIADRLHLINIGRKYGVPIFFVVCNRPLDEKIATGGWRLDVPNLIEKHDGLFRSLEKEILRGDGVANVIDSRHEEFEVINKPSGDFLEYIKSRGFKGVMAVADVHGMKESLKGAIDWAIARNLYLVFLGDVIDYGPDSIDCVSIVYDQVVRGRASFTIGNHEHKINRWFDQYKSGIIRLKLSDGNKATTDIVEKMNFDSKTKFEAKFKTLINLGRNHWVMGDYLFTHAAANNEFFKNNNHRLRGEFEALSLYGEVDKNSNENDGYPKRLYGWTESFDENKTVIVGHDIRGKNKPLIVKNDNGSSVIFLDTGCGKGGMLSAAHIIFEDMQIKAFTNH